MNTQEQKELEAVKKERDELKEVSQFIESEYLNEDDSQLTMDAQLLKYKGLFKKLEAENAELKEDQNTLTAGFNASHDFKEKKIADLERKVTEVKKYLNQKQLDEIAFYFDEVKDGKIS